MFYTYVLLSEVDKEFYIGYTEDLENRLSKHEKGMVPSTSKRRPLNLIYFEACLNKYDALRRENYFKTGFGRRFLHSRLESFLQGKDFEARDGGRGR
jgi:putative endonuclease